MTRATYFGRITATLIGASLFALGTASAQTAPITEVGLDEGFANPPQSARPRVWWHWMNGNVTIDGIDKDLDWMARMGIGGLQNFDANLDDAADRGQAPCLHAARLEGCVQACSRDRRSQGAGVCHRRLAGLERDRRALGKAGGWHQEARLERNHHPRWQALFGQARVGA